MTRAYVGGSHEFVHQALAGQLNGIRRVVFSGFNLDIDTATVPEDVWANGGLIPVPAAAESWEILSSSAADTAAGTGARTIVITTLDADYNEVVQVVTLNGVTPVALTGTHIRINGAVVATVGSGGINAGTLTIRVAGAGATRGVVTSPEGVLNQAKYTVPDGFHLNVMSELLALRTMLGSENAVITAVVTNAAGRSLSTVRVSLFAGGTSLYRHEVGGAALPTLTLPSRSEITFRCVSASQNNTAIDVAVLGLLYNDSVYPLQ